MLRILAAIAALTTSYPSVAAEVRISRGTTVCILDPSDLSRPDAANARCKQTAYLPPGTVADRIENRRASDALLLETRLGLAARATPNSRFWSEKDFAQFREAETVAFVTRDAPIAGVEGLDGTPCKLSRGEWYKVDRNIDTEANEVSLALTDRKTQCVRSGTAAVGEFLRRNAVLVQFTGNDVRQLDENDNPISVRPAYRPFELKNLAEFTKECGVEIDNTGKVSGSLKFDLGELLSGLVQKLPIGASAGFEKSISFKRSSPKERQETAQFFHGPDAIQIGQRKECEKTPSGAFRVPAARWYYVAAGDQNADLDAQWLADSKIRANTQTKSARISCAREYFALADALRTSGFPRETIPFLISRVAEIDEFGSDTACGS